MSADHTIRTRNAMLMAGMPLETALGQCWVETLTTLGIAGHILGGKVQGLWPMLGKLEVKPPRQTNRRGRGGDGRRVEPCSKCSSIGVLSMCPPLARRVPNDHS